MTTFNPTTSASNQGNTGSARPATPAQIKWYMDMCVQKKLTPVNVSGLTHDQMSELLQETRDYRPVTDAQRELIVQLIEEAGIPMPDESFFAKLTGGTNGLASRAIARLRTIVSEVRPPNDYQIEQMAKMFWCPAVSWSNYGITTKIMLGQMIDVPVKDENGLLIADNEGKVVMKQIEMWRWLTVPELVEAIKANFKYNDASKFLDDHRVEFENWAKTRATQQTRDMIRQFEDRLANIYVPKATFETAVDIEGNRFDVENPSPDFNEEAPEGKIKPAGLGWVAYSRLDDAALFQFTQAEAVNHLNNLRNEYARKQTLGTQPQTPDERKFGITDLMYTDMNDVEGTREAQSKSELNALEWDKLNNIMFALCAATGEDDMELIQSSFFLFSEGSNEEDTETTRDKRQYIRAYMMRCIEDGFITMDGMLTMIDRCQTAKEILFGVNKKGKFEPTKSWQEIQEERERIKIRLLEV